MQIYFFAISSLKLNLNNGSHKRDGANLRAKLLIERLDQYTRSQGLLIDKKKKKNSLCV